MKINKNSGIPFNISAHSVFPQWSKTYYLCSLDRFILMYQSWPYPHSVHAVGRKHGLWDCSNTQILNCGECALNSFTWRHMLSDNEVSLGGSPIIHFGYLSLCTDTQQLLHIALKFSQTQITTAHPEGGQTRGLDCSFAHAVQQLLGNGQF